jgi:hypothetical protein
VHLRKLFLITVPLYVLLILMQFCNETLETMNEVYDQENPDSGKR